MAKLIEELNNTVDGILNDEKVESEALEAWMEANAKDFEIEIGQLHFIGKAIKEYNKRLKVEFDKVNK